MDYFRFKINQFIIDHLESKKTTIRSFASKPSKPLEKKLGKVFGLIEIEDTDPKIAELTDIIIEDLKTNYYTQRKDKPGNPEDAENNFENVLQKVNLTISSFLGSEYADLDLKKVNIILGLVVDRQLIFSQIGRINIYLLQYLKKNDYRIIDVLEASHTPLNTPDPLKMFSQIVVGRINPRDILFISTTNVLDYFSLEKIKNVISGRPMVEGTNELRGLLNKISNRQSFGVLVSEIEKTNDQEEKTIAIKEFNYQQAASKDSMYALIKTEKETEKLLTPSLLPEVKKYIKAFNSAVQNYLIKARDSRSILSKKIISLPKFKLTEKINRNLPQLQNLTKPIQGKTKNTFNKIKDQKFWREAATLIKKIFGKSLTRLNKLPASSKVLLLLSIVLAFVFIQNIIWSEIKNKRQIAVETFSQIFLEAEMKKNESEASLIYRDESQARKLLIEAKNLIASIEAKNETQRNQIKNLNDEIENQLQALRHITTIDDPTQIVNFKNLDNDADIANLAIKVGDAIYTQNQRNQIIYKANLNSRVIAGIFAGELNIGNFKTGINIGNSLIFLTDNSKTFLLNPSNDVINPISIEINDNAQIIDMATYNNRLYLLDVANNRIDRFNRSGNNFNQPTNWLEDNSINLKDAVALTIDGSIYVLKNSGQIIKFQQGKQIEFNTAFIDPVPQNPTKIKTTETSNYLYILDPPTKRLVVINKEGQLIQQYTSEKFNDLKDFIVVEVEKKIYLLANSSIYGITAQHLE